MALGKSTRASGRLKESERMRIIDDSSRKRRLRKFYETLEADNFHEDPYADFVMSKKLPKFDDVLDTRTRKKRERTGEYYQSKYRKGLQQMIEEDIKDAEEMDRPSYMDILAPCGRFPGYYMCAVCGYNSNYNCITCGIRVCHTKCFKIHYETRCQRGA